MTDDDAGDAACWLDLVCDVCGGFIDDRREHRCRPAVDRSGSAARPIWAPSEEVLHSTADATTQRRSSGQVNSQRS